jgi:hypothetical protein
MTATTKTTAEQHPLFDDDAPDLHPYLAPLLIKANKVQDAAADFISAAQKALENDKQPIYGGNQLAVINVARTMNQIIRQTNMAIQNLRHPKQQDVTLEQAAGSDE